MSNPVPTYDVDVVVVGLGAIGASALWRLADRGISVLGVEQFTPGHDRGSSHGNSRLFRVACLEHPNLVTVARRSRDLWHELEKISGRDLLTTTGSITIGPPDAPALTGALEAAREHDLAVEVIPAAEVMIRMPHQADVPAHHIGLIDPEAGVLRPESAITAAVAAATNGGAQVLSNTRVNNLELTSGGVRIETPNATVNADQAVVTAGAWLGTLVDGLSLRSRRVMQSWFRPRPGQRAGGSFDLGAFPVFIRELDDGTAYWGHGQLDGEGVKIGVDWDPDCRWTDPDQLDREVAPTDHRLVSGFVDRFLPGLDPEPVNVTPCMVTYTSDHQFLIGRPADDARLVIGGGGSGHAFKHAAGLGELLAQITTGHEPFVSTDFLSPTRTQTPT